LEEEIGFVMRTAQKYLTKTLTRRDVRSVFAGLRPLAAPDESSSSTKEISRSHKLIVSESGLVTITGGKWTTYRKMAEDTVDKAIIVSKLPPAKCVTKDIAIHGSEEVRNHDDFLSVYGSDRAAVLKLCAENPEWSKKLHPHFDYIRGEVIWAVRHEMARTVEDVLARRLRALFLDARAAVEMAPVVASLMAKELKRDHSWEEAQVANFNYIAEGYLLMGS